MLKQDFSVLQQRKIIDMLIEGDYLPYQTGNNIKDMIVRFGYNHTIDTSELTSRWQIMKALLTQLNQSGQTQGFFDYILSANFLKSAIEAQNNDYKISNIDNDLDRNKLIEQGRKKIQDEFIKAINDEIIYSHKKINYNNHILSITNPSFNQPDVNVIKDKIDSGYISSMLEKAKDDLNDKDYDSVVTKARTILEEVFIQIIEDNNEVVKNNGKIGEYRGKVHEILGMKKSNDWDEKIIRLVSFLNGSVSTIAELRNINSDSHGVSKRTKINEAEAELIINSAVTLGNYYLKVNDRHNN
ncbi:abortive infection family protein [Leuconostoc citreum]|uniref:Abortive phage resistance protein n=1 Tax=Leuconostoc citreum (strain KM20) TaxID=349519 RepID=B1MYV6_LEUCK|nr:abortive infection family protein [Leuconostoc citreum]ACA82708.1 Abortive phage resistance protein [Leuconostoc citreum KM20]